MRQATRNTFFAVREFARSRFPDWTADVLDYDYTYQVTKDDETSGGTSAGLPTALGFLSVFLQRPVPQDMAFSGVIVAEAHDVLVVRHVGEVEFKVKAAYNRNLRRLLLPRDNRVDVESNAQVPRSVAAELVRYVANLNEAVSQTWGEDLWTRDGSGPEIQRSMKAKRRGPRPARPSPCLPPPRWTQPTGEIGSCANGNVCVTRIP